VRRLQRQRIHLLRVRFTEDARKTAPSFAALERWVGDGFEEQRPYDPLAIRKNNTQSRDGT
jgi:hypothetical protein